MAEKRIEPEAYTPADEFEFVQGVEVSSGDTIPDGMVYREIPGNLYAKFRYRGTAEKCGESVHSYFYSTWMRENGYEAAGLYNLEVYGSEFKGADSEESEYEIWFPIRQREKASE